ncbi:TPA: cupin domain-containing protein [Pseudomonas aeruginosa]|uniref:cupin domain-containing protein n=1 Tax=Pseudomonas TaxID=286 RepID=UPI001A25E6ED|nr:MULTISPECIES: cupin domain-containing protein [Pseudomonas]MBH9518269.1 cupin domain-containing protein [Pseudomonas aeruginosa]MBI8577300.1 cupin domain-containing protein [Pseudomonas aeruginosa]MBI8804325.1 cupin domain-containing protein [Pseudomonas aeruginosa]MCU9210286.1 cupin domain-containing protein [Pseudomonas aeruginosa]MDA3374415.1 cupin domain-containing protein [Pseudomonas aeruginosa]
MIPERLNADLGQRAIMHGATLPWLASPLPGVDRRPLYRVGAEQARATSLVRYAPGSHFSAHLHSGGEEFLVLEGVFEDEHGRYPVGSYVRNPPGSRHSPGARGGCMIFVRLRQFHVDDREQRVVQLNAQGSQLLFENAHERVWVEDVPPRSPAHMANPRGLELLVLEGAVAGEDYRLEPLGWMRLPPGMPFEAEGGPEGARLWIKDASPDLGF